MWVLECDGDLFQYKKLWLRPGKSILIGRTGHRRQPSPTERHFQINNMSVSRKHLLVEVAPITPGHGSQISKSRLTISDESKFGTYLDGDKFAKESRSLTKDVHLIRLGSWDQVLKISWCPTVLSFSFSDKKVGDLHSYRDRVESLDVKTIEPYVVNSTTHLVATKRNTAKGLQALINAKYIVTPEFINALVKIAASPGTAEDGSPLSSPLEEDFDASYPDSLNYLPEAGREPNPRPSEYFAPNQSRISIFEGFQFVFCDEKQHVSLADPVSNGGAKCHHYPVKMGQTPVGKLVEYVKSLAGQKGNEAFNPGKGKGPVVVRFRGKGDTAQWAIDFLREVDQELGQRSIEQNEFLDTILMIDTTGLAKPLEEEPEGVRAPPSTAVSSRDIEAIKNPRTNQNVAQSEGDTHIKSPPSSIQQPQSQNRPKQAESQSSPSKPPTHRLKSRRTLTQPRFKGFDNFDEPPPPKRRSPSPIDEEGSSNEEVRVYPDGMDVDSQPLFVTDSQPGRSDTAQPARSKKRPTPRVQDADAMMDELLPGQAAMKKRRLELGLTPSEERRQASAETTNSRAKTTRAGAAAGKSKKDEEVDIRGAARSLAKDLDRTKHRYRRANGESDSEDEDDVYGDDVPQLRNLAIVEEMPVPQRQRNRKNGSKGRNEHNPDWAHRPNFKRFKRKGEPAAQRGNRAHKVIVPLVEAKRKDFGMGEEYWLEESPRRGRGRPRGLEREIPAQDRASQRPSRQNGLASTSIAEGNGDDDEDDFDLEEISAPATASSRPSRVSRSQSQSQRGKSQQSSSAASHPRQTQTQTQTRAQARSQVQSQSQAQQEPSGRAKGKRAAAEAGVEEPRQKRQKQSRLAPRRGEEADDGESSEEDELKFRRRRRR